MGRGVGHPVGSEGFSSREVAGGGEAGRGVRGVGREDPSFRRWLLVIVQASDSKGPEIHAGSSGRKFSTFLLVDF